MAQLLLRATKKVYFSRDNHMCQFLIEECFWDMLFLFSFCLSIKMFRVENKNKQKIDMKEPELNPKLPVSLPISEWVLECLNLTNVTILSCEDFMKSLAT